MWIVQTSSGQVKGKARQFGTYRRVAVICTHYWAPGASMISERSRDIWCPRGARSGVIDLGTHSVGKTERCAYRRALARAEEIAHRLNNAQPDALPQDLWTWGGSA